jgi:hypothetical protein
MSKLPTQRENNEDINYGGYVGEELLDLAYRYHDELQALDDSLNKG